MTGRLVSVIVPTYNRVDCLLDALECVRLQTHADWELIVVDDGSTDDTATRVAEKFAGDARLRYIYQPNAGVSHARNTGLAAVGGDFVAFLDSDDEWKPWKLAAQLACMDLHPEVGMVWTDMEAMDETGTVMETRHLRTMYSAYRCHDLNAVFTGVTSASSIPSLPEEARVQEGPVKFYFGDIFAPMILGSLVHTSTVLLRRERALAVGGFDESLKHSGEDYDFHLRTCKAGPVGFLDVSAIRYRKGRPDRLTRHTDSTALNFLATVEKAVSADTEGRLRRHDVRQALIHAHGWVAEEKFRLRDGRGVRRHALRSLRGNLAQRRLIVLTLISFLPLGLLDRLLRAYQAVKVKLRS